MIPNSSPTAVLFPEFRPEFAQTAHRYYGTHFRFVLEILRCMRCGIEFFKPVLTETSCRTRFALKLGEHWLLFDVSDYHDSPVAGEVGGHVAVFKFHHRPPATELPSPGIYPISPISFYDWAKYEELCGEIKYRASGRVLNNQRPHTQNFQRRSYVRALLEKRYKGNVDLSVTPQLDFWRKVGGCLVAVCVPGARIDILDRGQLRYMAFGACTISPRLSIDLPCGERLVPGVHYLECRADWKDLIDVIEWGREHPGGMHRHRAERQTAFSTRVTRPAAL